MDDVESKSLSWAFVTADRKLTDTECELIAAYIVPSGATTDTSIYNGVDTNGQKIITLVAAAVTLEPFIPPKPIYCRRGLYVDIGTNTTGVFVLWRNL